MLMRARTTTEAMDKKPKRRTRERILEASLRLFNEFGEPNVTTGLIADDMNISPGNLYYHYRNKDEIINAIFADFEKELGETLGVPTRRALNVDDIWLFLHLCFELISKYRFLYRDLNDLLSRNRLLEVHFKRILEHSRKVALQICDGLVAAGDMRASVAERQAIATNIVVVASYWLSYEYVCNPRKPFDDDSLARGVYQVMALAAPYLVGDSRRLLEMLAQKYIAVERH